MRWCSWVIWMVPAALQLYAPTALAADMPQEIVGSWSQQKNCSNAEEFDQKGYTTLIDGKGHRCNVERAVAIKNQSSTTPAWRLELDCGRKFMGGQQRIYAVIRINNDNAPQIMALAETEDLIPRNAPKTFLAIYFRCK
jgi:hypothetical protein